MALRQPNHDQQPRILPPGEPPELGVVPKYMLAQTIREERFGDPKDALRLEEVEVPEIGPREVLVYVMAAGVNYNIAWAAQGLPLNLIRMRQQKGQPEAFHIGGSDAAGVVWKVGAEVGNVRVGDEVILHGGGWADDSPEFIHAQGDSLANRLMWGYEVNYGGLGQYARAQAHQCIPKPKHLTWEEAGCYMVGGATAYRMLHSFAGNQVQAGDPVLVWGGSGGLGSMAIQVAKVAGARPVAVISGPEKEEHCKKLGAVGVINRKEFDHWGVMPHWGDTEKYLPWLKSVKGFGRSFWNALGEQANPKIVIEHPGEDTIPTSMFVVDAHGMVVICAGTTGYNATLDLRYHWTRQKRLQGSHFANDQECIAITNLIAEGKVRPCLSRLFQFEETGMAHQLMYENAHPPGNMAILINAPQPGMTTLSS